MAELYKYCWDHLAHEQKNDPSQSLYRIFYYDCSPLEKTVYHPLKQQGIDFRHSETFQWMNDFLDNLRKQRKVALRLGELSDKFAHFSLSPQATKELFLGKKQLTDISGQDFSISFTQKGVDMKIGIDIASLAYKKQVDQIILISGDSDFVPAAKLARREGIDFILDPMWAKIKPNLFEHIDGLHSNWKSKKSTNSHLKCAEVDVQKRPSMKKTASPSLVD